MENKFLLSAWKIAQKCAGPFMALLNQCAMPKLIEKKQEALDAAIRGEVIDPDTGEVIEKINPDSPKGREHIKNCKDNLKAHELHLGGPSV